MADPSDPQVPIDPAVAAALANLGLGAQPNAAPAVAAPPAVDPVTGTFSAGAPFLGQGNPELAAWYASAGFKPWPGNAPGGGPMGGPPGPPPGAPGTLPGRFPPPQRQFGPTEEQWSQYRQDATLATQGINRMPYVFPGDQHSYQALATTAPADIFNMFYKQGTTPATQATTGTSASGIDPATRAILTQFAPQLGGLALGAGLVGNSGGLGGLGGAK